jgi:hypothetical protein
MTPSRKQIGRATGIAIAIAGVLLVTTVLPAEYGIDPLGTGKALGLLELFGASAEPAPPAVDTSAEPTPRVYKTESTSFTLRPAEAFEYKYRLEKDRGMVYAWKATGAVKYEFHGEPEDHRLKVVSYDKQENDYASGTLTAPFTGIHGWYWENAGSSDLTITLTTAGFYTAANELRPKFDPVKHKNLIERVPHELRTPPEFSGQSAPRR